MRRLILALLALLVAAPLAAQDSVLVCVPFNRSRDICGPIERDSLLALLNLQGTLAELAAERDAALAAQAAAEAERDAALATNGGLKLDALSSNYLLRYGTNRDRYPGWPLDRSTWSWTPADPPQAGDRYDIYVFAKAPPFEIDRVAFTLDGQDAGSVENAPPFDLYGTAEDGLAAAGLNLLELAPGEHQLCATYWLLDGNAATSCGSFTWTP